jgi:gas vesicle protein
MGSKLLWGFTLGLLAGLLLAPEKGSETRQRLSRKANDLKDKFDDFIDDLSEKFESLKKDAESMGKSAKAEAQSYAGNFPNGAP